MPGSFKPLFRDLASATSETDWSHPQNKELRARLEIKGARTSKEEYVSLIHLLEQLFNSRLDLLDL